MTKRNTHHNRVRPRNISRREFIKVAAVAGLVAGCGTVEQPTSKPTDIPPLPNLLPD